MVQLGCRESMCSCMIVFGSALIHCRVCCAHYAAHLFVYMCVHVCSCVAVFMSKCERCLVWCCTVDFMMQMGVWSCLFIGDCTWNGLGCCVMCAAMCCSGLCTINVASSISFLSPSDALPIVMRYCSAWFRPNASSRYFPNVQRRVAPISSAQSLQFLAVKLIGFFPCTATRASEVFLVGSKPLAANFASILYKDANFARYPDLGELFQVTADKSDIKWVRSLVLCCDSHSSIAPSIVATDISGLGLSLFAEFALRSMALVPKWLHDTRHVAKTLQTKPCDLTQPFERTDTAHVIHRTTM